ncbi:MAG: hypothetical protein AAF318_04555 [Pseudomonadota bacterium]
MRCAVALALCGAVMGLGPAWGQGEVAGRYQMERSGDDLLRLDTRTGQLDLCRRDGARMVCTTAAPGAAAAPEAPAGDLAAEVARLKAQNVALTARLARVAAAVQGFEPDTGLLDDAGGISATARREIDEAVDVTDYAVRRFRDLFRTFSDERDGGR